VPQCDLTVTAANGECLAMQTPQFGTATRTTAAIDPNLLNGWGIRPNDWQIGASIQQQVLPRVSVEFGYFHRWLNNFTATDNTLVSASDFNSFALNAPVDPRLPNGGGYAVNGLYNITSAAFARGASNNVADATVASNGGVEYSRYNGILINISARASKGLTFQGGINSGKTVQDICAITAALPELTINALGNGVAPLVGPTNPYWHDDEAVRRRVVRHPEDRRARRRHDPKRSGCAASRDVERSHRDGLGGARPSGGRGGHHDSDRPDRPWSGVGRSRERARLPVRQDPEVRTDTDQRRARYLQHHQLGGGVVVQPDVSPCDGYSAEHVARAVGSVVSEVREGVGANRLLRTKLEAERSTRRRAASESSPPSSFVLVIFSLGDTRKCARVFRHRLRLESSCWW
jgi:hypothetical protein